MCFRDRCVCVCVFIIYGYLCIMGICLHIPVCLYMFVHFKDSLCVSVLIIHEYMHICLCRSECVCVPVACLYMVTAGTCTGLHSKH